jgi:hypothetical protein
LARALFAVIAADILLIAGEFYVSQDLAWRSSYATGEHLIPSFSYSFLTQFFTMAGGPLKLVSPPTLDWVQALAIVLVAINGWFLYAFIRARSRVSTSIPKTTS